MIDIEQHALRALEQDALAGAALGVEQIPDGVHEGQDFRRDGEQFLAQRRDGDFRQTQPATQRIVMGERAGDLVVERIGLGEIHDPDRTTADLVFIGGTNAALGGPDLGAAARFFAMRVEFAM